VAGDGPSSSAAAAAPGTAAAAAAAQAVRRNPRYRPHGGGNHRAWPLASIRDVHRRRYLLKNNGLEIFLTNGRTYMLALATKAERDAAYDKVPGAAPARPPSL
jgi:hypothetical protein